MRKIRTAVISAISALAFIPAFATANSGDFSGGVAIGTGYAGVNIAPTNDLIVQGSVGIGTALPYEALEVANSAGGRIIASNGNGAARQVILLQAPGTAHVGYSRINSFDYGPFAGLPLIINDLGGSVGIGTSSARGGSELDVSGTIYVGVFGSSSSTVVCQNSNILSSCTSARRFKDNIEPSELGLKEVLAMKPVTFDLKDHDDNWEKHDFGFIAEDMEKINPLFVTYDDKGEINGVRYMQLTAVNAKAIQELSSTIQSQQKRLDQQQSEIDELKITLSQLTQKK